MVKDAEQAYSLYSMGTFGSYIGQRMNFANAGCFPSKRQAHAELSSCLGTSEDVDIGHKEHSARWLRNTSRCGSLFLSPEEVVFLTRDVPVLEVLNESAESLWQRFYASHGGLEFVRKYAVYRLCRRSNWVVRSGIFFGADYLLYKDGPDFNHSSAAVRIAHRMEEPFLAAMQRELGNCKKALVVASARLSEDTDYTMLSSLDSIEVVTMIPSHWEANRTRMSDLDSSL